MTELIRNIAGYFPVQDPTWIFFIVLGIILFAPIVFGKLRIPHIIGMILAGMVIGEHGLNIIVRDSSFQLFGNVGLLYIMFLAGMEMDMNDFKSAFADAEAALKVESNQDAFSLRGDACLGLKDYDKAIESFAEARRIDNSVAEAYYRKSLVLQASGQQEAAADSLKQAVALDPNVEDRLR